MDTTEILAQADASRTGAAHVQAAVLLVGEVAVTAHEGVATRDLDGVVRLSATGATLKAIKGRFCGVGGARRPVEAHGFAPVAQATVAPLARFAPYAGEAGRVLRRAAGAIRRPQWVYHVGQPPSAWVSIQPPTTEAGNPRDRMDRTSANFVHPPATAPPRDHPFGSRAKVNALTG